MRDLRSRADKADQLFDSSFGMISSHLCQLAMLLNLSSTERISVYKHDGRAFVLVGRYSDNPKYRERGRGSYPDDEGLIGRGWQDGHATRHKMPNYERCPEAYLAYQIELGMPPDVVRNLTMKSRSMIVHAITDPANNGNKIAVLVTESTQPRRLRNTDVAEMLSSQEGRRLVQTIDQILPYCPGIW